MKKINFLLIGLSLIILLVSCNKKEDSKLIITTPGGAVGISHANFYNLDDNYVDLDIVDGTQSLQAAFGSKASDIIIAPNNLGVKFYNSNKSYLYAGSITWGNIFLATSTDGEFTFADLENKKIYIFGEGSIPAMVIKHLVEYYSLNVEIENLGDATTLTSQKLILEPTSICLIAQPALFTTIAKLKSEKNITNIKQIDIQNEWAKIYDDNSYPQAGIFINSKTIETKKNLIDKYLIDLKISADFVNNNKMSAANIAINNMSYPQTEAVLINTIISFNIKYLNALESKESVINVLELYMSIYPNSITLPDADFYYH